MKGKWIICVLVALAVGLKIPCSAPEYAAPPKVLFIGKHEIVDGLHCVELGDMADALAEREYQCVIFQADNSESPEFQLDTYRMAAIQMIRTQPQAQLILQGIPENEELNEEIGCLAAKLKIEYAQPSAYDVG